MLAACATAERANSNLRNNNVANSANANGAASTPSPSNTSRAKAASQPAPNPRGTIEVTSVPPGAMVMLVSSDEGGAGEPKSKGVTPTSITGLQPGKYTVDLEKPGYRFFQKEVVVKEGAVIKVNGSLKKQ
jgi:hypothetical protein